MDIHRLFKRGELAAIRREALKDGPRNTRELAQAVMPAKGLDTGDRATHLTHPAIPAALIGPAGINCEPDSPSRPAVRHSYNQVKLNRRR